MKSTNLLFLAVFLALYFAVAAAQKKPDYSSAISIKIQSSLVQPTVGSGLGVSAEIENVSDTSVFIQGKSLSLTLPPELGGPFSPELTWRAGMPTEIDWEGGGYYDDKTYVRLWPGDTYRVFWSPGREDSVAKPTSWTGYILRTINSELKFFFFSPGEYTLTLNAKYWFDTTAFYHTVTKSTTLHFAAPQSVILVGAAFGGLIAFYLLPQARRRVIGTKKRNGNAIMEVVEQIVMEIAGIFGSILLSAIVTILLSRVSETQFFIKVTITDLWGAIAIGFVANYFGAKALDKLLKPVGSSIPSADGAASNGKKALAKEDKHDAGNVNG